MIYFNNALEHQFDGGQSSHAAVHKINAYRFFFFFFVFFPIRKKKSIQLFHLILFFFFYLCAYRYQDHHRLLHNGNVCCFASQTILVLYTIGQGLTASQMHFLCVCVSVSWPFLVHLFDVHCEVFLLYWFS